MQLQHLILMLKQHLLYPIYRDWGAGRVTRGDYDKAVRDCTRAIHLCPNDAEPYYHRANAHYYLRDFDRAIADYEAALARNPLSVHTHIGLGNLYYDAGDYSQAVRCYNLALYHQPGNARVYYNRGLVAAAQGNYQHAIKDYTEALRLKPEYGFIYGNRGEMYFMLGRYNDALNDFRNAHRVSPMLRRAVAGMAIARHALGETLESIRLWQILLALNTQYEDANWVAVEHAWDPVLTDEVRGLLADLDTNQ